MNSVILGDSVTKYAKSPIIWNYLYDYFELKSRMIPIDTSSEDLHNTIDRIRDDISFGLISSPLKGHPYWKKFKSSENVALSESANFFRIENDGDLYLENFDGGAAVESLERISANPWKKKVAIMGTGPLGRTIAAALMLKSPLENSDITFLSNTARSELMKLKLFNAFNFKVVDRNKFDRLDFEIIINCTPIGSPRNPGSLLRDGDFAKMSKDTIYFDINYGNPIPAGVEIGKRHGLLTLDGTQMNMFQATDAFRFANKVELSRDKLIQVIESI